MIRKYTKAGFPSGEGRRGFGVKYTWVSGGRKVKDMDPFRGEMREGIFIKKYITVKRVQYFKIILKTAIASTVLDTGTKGVPMKEFVKIWCSQLSLFYRGWGLLPPPPPPTRHKNTGSGSASALEYDITPMIRVR